MSFAQAIAHPTMPLGHVARVLTSGVDKKSHDGESPVRLCNYTAIYYNDRITADMAFMEATATEAEIERFTLLPGDVVITKDSETADDIAIPALVVEDLGGVVLGYHNALVRPDTTTVDPRFLFWTLMARQSAGFFETKARGVTRVGLRADDIATLPVPVPSLEVQRRVADVLDAETARMDTLIDRTRRASRLLDLRARGRREELIVEHEVAPLRYYVRSLTQGSSPNVGDVTAANDEPGLLRLSALRPGEYRPEHSKAVVGEDADRVAHLVPAREGMVLVSRANTPDRVGDACLVDDEPVGGRFVPDLMFALVTNVQLDPAFLTAALTTRFLRGQMEAVARGSSPSMVKLRQDDVLSLAVPMPALQEQRSIVDELCGHGRGIREVDTRIARQQELLRTRRQALITAAVTGQINV